jgi:hypothetical protein
MMEQMQSCGSFLQLSQSPYPIHSQAIDVSPDYHPKDDEEGPCYREFAL